MSKTVSANLKTELQSGAPVVATCWKIQRADGTVLGFTDWPESFDYLSVTYNSTGGYQRTAIDQREGLSVDNMDVIGIIDSSYITESDLLAGLYRGAKVWIFAVSPGNLAWGDLKLDYGVIGEIHIGEIHFVAEFRSLITKLSQEFGSKFSRYCRHKLGSSLVVNGVQQKCGVVLEPGGQWAANTAYSANDGVSSQVFPAAVFTAQTSATSGDYSAARYGDTVNNLAGLVSHWRLDEPPADTNWSSVVLALHCDGTDGSTTFTDEKGKTGTAVGNAHIETDDKVFGTASGYFDGTGDYVHFPDSTDWDWGAGTYTVEMWAKFSSWPGAGAWATLVAWHVGTTGWRLLYDDDARIHLSVNDGSDNGFFTAAGTISLNTWHHIAFVINSSGHALAFIDGVLLVTDTSLTMTAPTSTTLKIGSTDGSNWFHHGYIDDLLITKGVAKYSADFDLPSTTFSHGTDPTVSVDSKGANDATLVNTPTLGETGLPANFGRSMKFVRANSEYATVPAAASINNFFATGPATVEAWIKPTNGIGTGTQSARIVAKDDGLGAFSGGRSGWALAVEGTSGPSGVITFFQRFDDGVSAVSNGSWSTPAGSIAADTEYHVVVVYDASDETNVPSIYIDGVLQTLTTNASPTATHTVMDDSTAVLSIGNNDPAGAAPRYFDGHIDEICMYDGALSTDVIVSNHARGTGIFEPYWNSALSSTTLEAGGPTWKSTATYRRTGTVGTVTSDYKFTDTGLTDADGYFQYGVLTWLTGDNAGLAQDVKDSTALGVVTLRQPTPYTIQVGDTYKITAGCNHILKMPSDTLGTAYTGDCRAKFDNVANFGGEPEMPNIDRVSAPASNVK